MDYQVVVSAALLVQARGGCVPATAIRPEGFEDVDALPAALVQVKDRAGGSATWSRSEMAAAIAHAVPALTAHPEARFVVVTNARIGQGLRETGWAGSLGRELPSEERSALVAAVQARDSAVDPALLERCGLHRESRAVLAESTVARLQADYGVSPAVAEVVFAVLLDDLQQAAAAQRFAELSTAAVRTPNDLDALVHDLASTLDLTALEGPVVNGLIGPVDFRSPTKMGPERFLLGVNVRPGHIAASLDVLRPSQMEATFAALREGRGAVICGPSGAGKSALLWRCANELADVVRLAELHRIGTGDVDGVLRWMRAQRPSSHSRLMVCADGLGRPEMSGWPELARRAADIEGIIVFGACREEDFKPEIVGDDLTLLRPTLDATLAGQVARQLHERGVVLRRTAEEALAESKGLLLEYVSLLTTGERLERVVDAQVHERLDSSRTAERETLRYVSAAHLGGLGVPFAALADLVDRRDELPASLARLAGEFLVASDDGCWVGLHEARSAAAHDALHRLPPPAQEETISRLLRALTPPDAGHLLRRVVDRGIRPDMLVDGIQKAISVAEAGGVAALLDAAIDVDALVHARSCWAKTLEVWGSGGADSALTIAFLARFGGAGDLMNQVGIREVAEALPHPQTDVAGSAMAGRTGEWLATLANRADAESAAALLEAVAVAGGIELSGKQGQSIWEAHAGAAAHVAGRIVFAVWSLAPELAADPDGFLGSSEQRIGRLADADERYIAWTGPGSDGRIALEVFSVDGELSSEMRSELGRLALDLCPEATGLDIVPRTPQGALQSIPANDEMHIAASQLLSPRISIRRNRAFLDALPRLRAAESWSERFRLQEALCLRIREILTGARLYVGLSHRNARRDQQWRDAVAAVVAEQGRLPSVPLRQDAGASVGSDEAGKVLSSVVTRLAAIATGTENLAAVGAGFYDSVRTLRRPATGPEAVLVRMVEAALEDDLERLARLLTLRARTPLLPVRVRPSRHGSWLEAIDRCVDRAEQEIANAELSMIRDAAHGLDANVHTVVRPTLLASIPGPLHLIVVDGAAWETDIWNRFDGMKHRHDIAFRVVVALQRSGLVLPTEAREIGPAGIYPPDPEFVTALAREAGVPVLVSEELRRYNALTSAIVDASGHAALAAARVSAGLGAPAAVSKAKAGIERCRELARGLLPPEVARSTEMLIETTERELSGERVMSQIVGDVLLKKYGDDNLHALALSTNQRILVCLEADRIAAG